MATEPALAAFEPVIRHMKEDGNLGCKAPWAARRRCLILRWRSSATGPDRHRAAARGEFRRECRGRAELARRLPGNVAILISSLAKHNKLASYPRPGYMAARRLADTRLAPTRCNVRKLRAMRQGGKVCVVKFHTGAARPGTFAAQRSSGWPRMPAR
jgi:hypothetical protein